MEYRYHDERRAQANYVRSSRSSSTTSSSSSSSSSTTTMAKPSFSSTLLDTIYRSIDEADQEDRRSSLERRTESFRVASKPNWKLLLLNTNNQDDATLTPTTPSDLHYLCKPRQHLRYIQQQRRDPFVLPSSSSSSSSSTSSSSDTDSGTIPIRLNPYRTSANHFPPAEPATKSRHRVSRFEGEPKKKKGKEKTPSSPGGRLAGFLQALFLKAKAKAKAKRRPALGSVEEKRRVSEFDLVREEEDEGASSDSSSDLFELEDPTGVEWRGIASDLPVYGSTSVGEIRSNGAVSRRALV